MINPFKSLGDLNKMRQEAARIQRELEEEQVEVEDGGVRVVMNGNLKILELEEEGEEKENLKRVLNKAIKETQEKAARKLTSMTGGLSGLLGK